MRIKVLKVCLLLLAITLAEWVNAQNITDENNDLLATMNGDTIYDSASSMLFYFESGGVINYADGIQAATIESDGTVKDLNSDTIGSVDSNGTVKDNNNDVLGTIATDGTVKDANNDTIGAVGALAPTRAAWYFFFSNN